MRQCVLAFLFVLPVAAQSVPARLFDGLQWRMIGPFRGGRTEAATGVPGDPNTFYFGSVGGGIWKTTDAGTVWTPVFDKQQISSIGAIEVAPSDPNIIYAGTGETDLRIDISFGDGVYKSTDAGKTWKNVGLAGTRHIGRILIHPTNPDIVFVAALGHAYAANEERGVFRSTDGGATWSKVLYQGPDLGAVDLAWAPEDPQTIYATLWNVRRPARIQYGPIEGAGSGLYKSTDGGDTWTRLTGHGLPEGDWRRAGVAVARGTSGRRVYALIDANVGGLYRSDDGGSNWVRVNAEQRLTDRGWYFGRITVDAKNPDVIYLPNIALFRSTDGGKTFSIVRGAPGGDDYHFLWVDPTASNRMILATDQGATISLDYGASWTTWYNQPTAQFYHVTTDQQFPYTVFGTQQDSGSIAVASRTNHDYITEQDYQSAGGSESGYIAPDPADPNILYVAGVYGTLARFDRRTAQGQDVTPLRYRFPWTPCVVFSPAERGTLYYGSQVLLKTINGGLDWEEISPDLTGPAKAGVIFTIAPSPLRAGEIWVGTDTGLIQLTRDGGKTWTDVTPKGISEWSKVTRIEASHFDPATAYAAVDRHRLDDYRPHLYRTRDYGKTWTEITGGIAEPAFLNAIVEDPIRRGLLYAGTEVGVSVSFDDGAHWQPLQLNLPTVSVRDLTVHGDDLVIATHGRSFWILDEIAPLRQAETRILSERGWLYKPARAIRTLHEDFLGTPLPPEIPKAANPPDGAILDYYLASDADPVTLEILDSKNQLVRRFSSADPPPAPPRRARSIAEIWYPAPAHLSALAGMHRFVWDLRYPVTGTIGPQALPGTYRVKLTAAGHTWSQPLEVTLDPRSPATKADLESQFDLGLKAARAMDEVSQAITETKENTNQDSSQILAGLMKAQGDLTTVLNIARSADRRPPTQAWTLYNSANVELAAQMERMKASHR